MTLRRSTWAGLFVTLAGACSADPTPAPAAGPGPETTDIAPVDTATTDTAGSDASTDTAADDADTVSRVDPGSADAEPLPDVAPPDVPAPSDGTAATDMVSEVADGADATDVGDVANACDGLSPADADADASACVANEPVPCTPGAKACLGSTLLTCGTKGDGWICSPCFPGTACVLDKDAGGKPVGVCKPVTNNLVIMFDSSGSMTAAVKKKDKNEPLCTGNYNVWPTCEYDQKVWPLGCTRMGVSKAVFKQALAKIDTAVTRIALFKFPQKVGAGGTSCSNGAYSGLSYLDGEPIGLGAPQTIQPKPGATDYYWNSLSQTLCVPFPKDQVEVAGLKQAVLKWMDGTEQQPNDPELRATGGTPIGKTLFYIGEYIRQVVVVDGKPCSTTPDCGNVNYACVDGKCKDASRSCRDTVVVLFTDGGEFDNNNYFSPRVQAKRLAFGLACDGDQDCVGGATCQSISACEKGYSSPDAAPACSEDKDCLPNMGSCKKFKQCTPPPGPTGWRCTATNAPCVKGTVKGEAGYCDPGPLNKESCVKEPYATITALGTTPGPAKCKTVSDHNVLRGWDGKAIGVTVHVVDIGSASATEFANSMRLAMAGNGKLLGADASDPDQFLGQLEKAFDMKNKKICGKEF